jgi:hypothetical protein
VVKHGKDCGKEPECKKEDFPWSWTSDERIDDFSGSAEFDGVRWNDPHYSIKMKEAARDCKQKAKEV